MTNTPRKKITVHVPTIKVNRSYIMQRKDHESPAIIQLIDQIYPPKYFRMKENKINELLKNNGFSRP